MKLIIITLCAYLAFSTLNANAASIVLDNGKIAGINQLGVDGVLWDLTFNSGNFNTTYSAPYSPPVTLTDNYISLYNYLVYNNFGSEPKLFVGCTAQSRCRLATPKSSLATQPVNFVVANYVTVDEPQIGFIGSSVFDVDTQYADLSWVTWQESPSQVPVPSAFWLLSSGIIGLVGLANKKQNC